MKQFLPILIVLLLCSNAFGDSLNGSPSAIREVVDEAERQDIHPVHTEAQLDTFFAEGKLVHLADGKNFKVAKMKFGKRFVLPETRMFINDFSDFLFEKCDQKSVVTSALRLTTN